MTDAEIDAAILAALPEAKRKYPAFFDTSERAWGAAAAVAVIGRRGIMAPPEMREQFLARGEHLMRSGHLDLISGRYTSNTSNKG